MPRFRHPGDSCTRKTILTASVTYKQEERLLLKLMVYKSSKIIKFTQLLSENFEVTYIALYHNQNTDKNERLDPHLTLPQPRVRHGHNLQSYSCYDNKSLWLRYSLHYHFKSVVCTVGYRAA